jgi:pseudouridine-5'-monophosphatase
MFERFRSITTGDDKELKRGKPAPDIFLLSARRDGVNPDRCLVFEDSP